MATSIISDGQPVAANLKALNLNTDWLHQQLQMAGVDSPGDIFYAEAQEDGTSYMNFKDGEMT